MRRDDDTDPPTPDPDIVASLQQLAHAQATLFAAENDTVGFDPTRVGDRNRTIEEVHTKLLWVRVDLLTEPQYAANRRALDKQRRKEEQTLTKYRFASFDAYVIDRTSKPTDNPQLQKARREYVAAHAALNVLLREKGAEAESPAALTPAPTSPPTSPITPTDPTDPTVAIAPGSGPPVAPTPPETANGSTRPPWVRIAVPAAAALLLVVLVVAVLARGRSTSSSADVATAPIVTSAVSSLPLPKASVPTTKKPAAVATTAKPTTTLAPTPSVAPTTAPSTAAPTTSGKTAAFCASITVFTLDNLPTLAEKGVADPAAMSAALDAFLANAPDDLRGPAQALEPLTRKAIAQVQTGAVTTPQALQQWLAAAPTDELAQWIDAQTAVVPEAHTLCGTA